MLHLFTSGIAGAKHAVQSSPWGCFSKEVDAAVPLGLGCDLGHEILCHIVTIDPILPRANCLPSLCPCFLSVTWINNTLLLARDDICCLRFLIQVL